MFRLSLLRLLHLYKPFIISISGVKSIDAMSLNTPRSAPRYVGTFEQNYRELMVRRFCRSIPWWILAWCLCWEVSIYTAITPSTRTIPRHKGLIELPQVVIATRQPFNGTPSKHSDPSTAIFTKRAKCLRNGFKDPEGGSTNYTDSVQLLESEQRGWSAVVFPLHEDGKGFTQVNEFYLLQVFYLWNASVTESWFGGEVFGPPAYIGTYSRAIIGETDIVWSALQPASANGKTFIRVRREVSTRRRHLWKYKRTSGRLWPSWHDTSEIWQSETRTVPSLNPHLCDIGRSGTTTNPCCMDIDLRLQSDFEVHNEPTGWLSLVIQAITTYAVWIAILGSPQVIAYLSWAFAYYGPWQGPALEPPAFPQNSPSETLIERTAVRLLRSWDVLGGRELEDVSKETSVMRQADAPDATSLHSQPVSEPETDADTVHATSPLSQLASEEEPLLPVM